MRTNVRLLQKTRAFSEEFKRSIVKEFESGRFSVKQLSRLRKIAYQTVYRWIYKYSTVNEKGIRIVEKSQSSSQKVKGQEKRIAELERALGQKQIKEEYLDHWRLTGLTDLKRKVSRAVKNYNTKRIHNHLNRKTTVDFEREVLTLELHNRRCWLPIVRWIKRPLIMNIS